MASKRPGNAGQKRAAKTKARQSRLKSGPTASAAQRSLRNLVDDFTGYLRETELASDAEQIAKLLDVTLTQMGRANPDFDPTAWTPDDAHVLLDIADGLVADNEEAALRIVMSSLTYLAFLDETDSWTGSDEDYAHCMDDFSDFVGDGAAMLEPEDVELPDIAPDDELAALRDLPLMTSLDTMLDWVGNGRDLTPTSLRELADALGVPRSDGESAYDVPKLAELASAASAHIITIDDGEATAGPAAEAFRARSDLQVLRLAAAHYVSAQLMSDVDEEAMLSVVDTLAAQSLLAAMLPDPPLNPIDDSYEGLEPDDRQVALLASERLRAFADQKWLVAGETLDVPPALRRAVLTGIEDAFPVDEPEDV
ncbi:hypothetical protein GCM10007304_10560 [Rhodococcoides trifolii]|uniref:Uncharacterized protein n=1 Tax=Rhodococcoides trifolii TaxID=908250 RepID=A0A917FPX1_9NOCA|nr:hypothetical protein [Rhodococcus trifolii]GGF98421.1 hypothetical protein GCM10007304_10560 [Rhodococcus trifolii]